MNNKLFSIGEAIKVGWEKAKSNFGSFFLIILVCSIIYAIINAFGGDPKHVSGSGLLVRVIGGLVGAFLQMGILRVVFKVLDGGKPAAADFTANPEQFGKFLLGAILQSIIVGVGFILLIIPGIILYIRLQFITYLIVEKNLGPMDALKRSWAITRGQGWKLFLFMLVCGLIFVLGLIALVIGLFWAIPTVAVAMAFVYRKLDRAAGMAVAAS